MVHAVIISKLDYCNGILINLPDCVTHKLQLVSKRGGPADNTYSLHRTYRAGSVPPTLVTNQMTVFNIRSLPWLSKPSIIQAQECIKNLLHPYTPSRGLRSPSKYLLHEPRYNMERYGSWAFQNAAPRIWNSLPSNLRQHSNLELFKKDLKTFFFSESVFPSYINRLSCTWFSISTSLEVIGFSLDVTGF